MSIRKTEDHLLSAVHSARREREKAKRWARHWRSEWHDADRQCHAMMGQIQAQQGLLLVMLAELDDRDSWDTEAHELAGKVRGELRRVGLMCGCRECQESGEDEE